MGCIAALFHPFRWIRLFFKAMLYGPDYSPYDEMAEKWNRDQGLGEGSRKQPRLQQGSRLLDDSDGFSDKDDESYYGMT